MAQVAMQGPYGTSSYEGTHGTSCYAGTPWHKRLCHVERKIRSLFSNFLCTVLVKDSRHAGSVDLEMKNAKNG